MKTKTTFKKIVSIAVLMLIGTYSAWCQQNTVFPMLGNSNKPTASPTTAEPVKQNESLIPTELMGDLFFEEYKLPYPVEGYGNDMNELRLLAKQKLMEAVFYDYCAEFSNLICYLLRIHAGALIKLPTDDFIYPTQRGDKKKGNFKFYLETALVNKQLINYIANNADKLFALNTVVLYHPINGSVNQETINLYEEARVITQNKINAFEYKMTSLKNIDVMPVCNIPKNIDSLNYYRELLEVVKREKRITAEVAFVIKQITVENIIRQANGYEALVNIQIDIFNANTYSFILTQNYRGSGNGDYEKTAITNAVEKILKDNIDKIFIQMTGQYYSYIMDGRETIIELYGSCADNDIMKEFLNTLEKSKFLNLSNIQIDDAKTEIKCHSYKIVQYDVYRLLNSLKPASMACKIQTEGNAFIFKGSSVKR